MRYVRVRDAISPRVPADLPRAPRRTAIARASPSTIPRIALPEANANRESRAAPDPDLARSPPHTPRQTNAKTHARPQKQLEQAHATVSDLLADREESLRHDEYVESMVEQAHRDTLRERAAFETKLRDAAEANAKVKKQIEDERAVHARVEQDLAEATRKLERDAREKETAANETESLRAKLHETFAALDDAKQARRRAEARVADFESRVDGAEQSAAEARARSPVHRRNNERLAGELAKAREEIEALKADAAKAREDLAALERRRRAEEEARRRDASSPAADRRRSRGNDPTGPPSDVAATAALEAREADVRAREDEIERAYADREPLKQRDEVLSLRCRCEFMLGGTLKARDRERSGGGGRERIRR